MDLKAYIGHRLKRARLDSSSTQEDLAEAIGKSVRTISSVESGQTLASLPTLEAMANALKMPLSYFFDGYGDDRTLGPSSEIGLKVLKITAGLSEKDAAMAVELLQVVQKSSKRIAPRLVRDNSSAAKK